MNKSTVADLEFLTRFCWHGLPVLTSTTHGSLELHAENWACHTMTEDCYSGIQYPQWCHLLLVRPNCCVLSLSRRVIVSLKVRGSLCSSGSEVSLCSVLRFCFRLLSCLGEADLLAMTYFKTSLPDECRHIIEKDLGCARPTFFHSLCFVPSLIGFHSGAQQRISELPHLSAPVSVFLCHTQCG